MSVQISKRAQSPLESPSAVQTASVDPSQLRPQSARQHPSVDVNRARPSTSSDFAQQPHAFDYVGPTSSGRASPNVLTELHAFSSRAQLPLRIPHRPNSASTIIQPTGDGLPPRFITSAPVDVAMHPTRLKQTPPSLKQSARLIKQSVRAVAPQKLVLDLRSQIFPTKAALTTSPREVPFTLAPGSFEHYETLATMRRAPLLKYLDDTQLHELLRLGRHKSFPRYSILLREGTRGCQLFVLLSGQAASASSKTSGYNVVAGGQTHERGACFGAPGLVTPILRDNTVSALSLCRVLILERWQLMRPPPPKPPPKPSRRPSQEAEDAQEDAPAAAPPSTAAAVAGGAGVAAETEDPEAGCDVHTRLASKGTQGTPSVLMECIQAGLEWAALKQAVFVGLLENVSAHAGAVAFLRSPRCGLPSFAALRPSSLRGRCGLSLSARVKMTLLLMCCDLLLTRGDHGATRPWLRLSSHRRLAEGAERPLAEWLCCLSAQLLAAAIVADDTDDAAPRHAPRSQVPFFDRMAESRRQELAQLMDLETHEAGAVLFREGDFGGRFQILSEGALEVYELGDASLACCAARRLGLPPTVDPTVSSK